MLTRSIVYKNVSLPSMTVSREEWERKEKDIMSKTIRNELTHRKVQSEGNGMPNIISKKDHFIEMGIIAGTMKPRVNEHWRNY